MFSLFSLLASCGNLLLSSQVTVDFIGGETETKTVGDWLELSDTLYMSVHNFYVEKDLTIVFCEKSTRR